MGQAPDYHLGGGAVVGDEIVGVFGQAEGTVEDFVVDALFPAFGTEVFKRAFELGEEFCGWEEIGFCGGAIEGGDYVEVEGGCGVWGAH